MSGSESIEAVVASVPGLETCALAPAAAAAPSALPPLPAPADGDRGGGDRRGGGDCGEWLQRKQWPAVLTEPVPVEAVASVDVMDSGQHAWSRPVLCHRRRQLHWCPQAAAVRTTAMVMAVDEWKRVNQSGGGQRAWPRDLCSAAGGGSCTVGTAATISALVHTGGDDGDDGSDGG